MSLSRIARARSSSVKPPDDDEDISKAGREHSRCPCRGFDPDFFFGLLSPVLAFNSDLDRPEGVNRSISWRVYVLNS